MSRRKSDRAISASRAHGGRPKLEDADRRDRRIGVPVNQHEEDAIGEKAKLAHMRKGVFLRHLGLGKHIRRPVPTINYCAYRQLGRLAAEFSYALILLDVGKSIGIDFNIRAGNTLVGFASLDEVKTRSRRRLDFRRARHCGRLKRCPRSRPCL